MFIIFMLWCYSIFSFNWLLGISFGCAPLLSYILCNNHFKVTVVNPSMDKALMLLQKFAFDAQSGKILEDRLRFGTPWRHPPSSNNLTTCMEWAKIQLMDFVQSLVNTEFGVSVSFSTLIAFKYLVFWFCWNYASCKYGNTNT